MLGGVWTAGLLNPLFDARGKGWLVEEIIEALNRAGAWRKWKFSWTFDTETMKLLLEQMASDTGVELLYHTLFVDTIVESGRVRGAIVESKSGREAILARVVIDCSGDGDVAVRGGAAFEMGRAHDGLCQPMTLMFEVEGLPEGFEQKNTESLYDQMMEAIARHGLSVELPFQRVNYAPWIINVPRPGAGAVQATHVYGMNGTDSRQVTSATIEARRQAHDL
jgi:flavin-dependent dehydrogenase